MVRALEIIDLADRRQLQLCLKRDGDIRTAPAVPFAHPLDEVQYQEFSWYFRDYLGYPFGPASTRAEVVEASLRNLGRLLFETVFQSNDEAQSCYATACADGLAGYQLDIISTRPSFLALPWELLNEPERGYLASRLASVIRLRDSGPVLQFKGSLTTDQFNVLLVSPFLSRKPITGEPHSSEKISSASFATEESHLDLALVPGGLEEIGSLAAETLSVLDSLESRVELDFLRPATFATLSHHLANRPEHYHLVHFDGFASSDPDELVFEGEDGGGSPVPASQVAELLTAAQVPVALLNSGNAGFQRSWAAATACLTSGGVPLTVSLPLPLSGPAPQLFLDPFYRAIVQGTDVPSAVAQARMALMDNPHRPTPSGNRVFWDWIGPTVYQSQTYTPAPIDQDAPAALAPTESQAREDERRADTLPRGGLWGMAGRWAEVRHLERFFEQGPVVLLWGDTGVGKTELALGLARWLLNTGARPGGVFYTSFEVGAGLERVVHETGTSVAGLGFADMSSQQQRLWLTDYLQDHPSLLVWDGLENVAGFPSQDAGLLEPGEQSELDGFLQEVAHGGQSWVLLVGRRKSEPWLSTPHQVHELGGLDRRDAQELGSKILENGGVFKSIEGQIIELRLGPDYVKLLGSIEGHPLAMQVALPMLREVPASVLLTEIDSRIGQLSPEDGEDGRPPYLTAVMDYSYSRLSRRSRTHLPFLYLFQSRVMMDIFTHFTQEAAYRKVMGEELGWGACRTLLRSARDAGFLEPVTPSIYQIHPSFPWFYGRQLNRRVRPSGIRLLEQEFVRVYADTADYFMEALLENQDSGVTAVLAEEGNLSQALALALESKQWERAQLLVQPLAQVYRMQKRYPELRRLRRQLLEKVSPNPGGAVAAEAEGAIELWLYLSGTEAGEATELGDLDRAEDLNQQLISYLSAQRGGEADPRTAAVYHQLGLVARQRNLTSEAEEWFAKSLEIIEPGEDRAAVADDYYCLGQVSLQQRRYAEAKERFAKSLDIHQRLQDEEEMVKDYRALGLASQYRFEHDEAESWYQRARSIVEESRDEETAILIYHELGTVYHARYQYDEAENWHRQALTLSDRLGKEEQAALEFHHLGLLAQTREMFYEDAEEWYLLALDKYEALGDRRSAGDECRQLGVLFHEQKLLDEAEGWYHRAREIFEELGDVLRTARTLGQLGVVAEERDDLSGALEWVARTYRLAAENGLPLLPQVKSHLARLKRKYGDDHFNTWWRGYTGGDPPTDLDVDPGTDV